MGPNTMPEPTVQAFFYAPQGAALHVDIGSICYY